MWQGSGKEVASRYTDLGAQLLATATPHLATRDHRQSWLGAVGKGHVDKPTTEQYMLYSLLSENSWWFCLVSDGRRLVGLSSVPLEWVKPIKKEWGWWQADSWKSRWLARKHPEAEAASLFPCYATHYFCLQFVLVPPLLLLDIPFKANSRSILPSVQTYTLWLQSRSLPFVIYIPVIYSTKSSHSETSAAERNGCQLHWRTF